MAPSHNQSKINNKRVEGRGHLQPGKNPWIGVFNVNDDLLEGDPESWKSVIITYKGPFDCRNECINGRAKGRIVHIRHDKIKHRLVINIEGIEEPKLEKEIRKEIRFSYNANLPIASKQMNIKNR